MVTEQLTPQYASPERLRGEAATVSSDVYSLGMILFELCSGGSPFPMQSSIVGIAERAGGHQTATGPAEAVTSEAAALRGTTPEKLRRQLQGDLASICEKALAFDPDQRYMTVTELAEDLRRFLGGGTRGGACCRIWLSQLQIRNALLGAAGPGCSLQFRPYGGGALFVDTSAKGKYCKLCMSSSAITKLGCYLSWF